MQLCISLRSRSDLILISFWMLTIPWTFSEPISFYRACISLLRCFRQTWRIFVSALFIYKSAVAHIMFLWTGNRTEQSQHKPNESHPFLYKFTCCPLESNMGKGGWCILHVSFPLMAPSLSPRPREPSRKFDSLWTDKVPQRNCVTKLLPSVRVNSLVWFASKPLF